MLLLAPATALHVNTTAAIGTWTALESAIKSSAGTKATLTLEAKFDMTGCNGQISLSAPNTDITLVGNGAVLNPSSSTRPHTLFYVGSYVGSGDAGNVKLVMSNVKLQNSYSYGNGGAIHVATGGTIILTSCSLSGNHVGDPGGDGNGGAIYVATGGTISLTSCTLSGNKVSVWGNGGAIYVGTGGTISLTSCTLSGNQAISGIIGDQDSGGALFFTANSTGLLTNCSFDGTLSPGHNDIARDAPSTTSTANITFACPGNLIGNVVEMQGNEITVIPPKELQCVAPKYSCDTLTGTCKQDKSGSFPSKQACTGGCTAAPTPAPCQVPRNCGQHNNSVVCGHTFTGCEFVCGKESDPRNVGCCHPKIILTDEICNGCVNQLCKPLPPLPPPVTTKYACITTPNYHCVEFPGGTFHTPTDCENDCKKPPAPIPTHTTRTSIDAK
jgi:hypothetical protein